MKILLPLFLASLCWGQPGTCYVNGVTTGCNALVSPVTGTPDFATYVGDITTLYKNISAINSSLPQTTAAFGGQLPGAETSYINAGAPFITASKENAYAALACAKSGQYCDIAMDPLAFSASSAYAAICGSGGGTCATPGGNSAAILATYESMAKSITAAGAKLRISWTPLSNTWTGCGIADPSVMTVATMDSCLGPFEATAAVDFAALSPSVIITDETVNHEPTGLFRVSTGQIFSTSDWDTSIISLCTWVQTPGAGAGVLCGTGFLPTEAAYNTAAIANAYSKLGFVGYDLYFNQTPASWTGTFTTLTGMCSAAVTSSHHIPCKVNEASIPRWCPSGGSSCSETDAYLGCGASAYVTAGVLQSFNNILVRGFSGVGATYISVFPTWPWIIPATTALSTDSCQDTSSGGYPAYVMNNVGSALTPAGQSWQATNANWNLAFTGLFVTTGNTQLK